MKHLELYNDRDRALGLIHLMVVDFRNLPLTERFCDRFEGEPVPRLTPDFLRDQLWEFELSDQELYSYALFLQVNLEEKFLLILEQEASV